MATGVNRLLAWYDSHKRDLPWRASTDAYPIWISEIMLQQTTVTAVVPYFNNWMKTHPTVESVANASEEEILSLWQGLGYYNRCKNIHKAAKLIVSKGWPLDKQGWKHLPGIGDYTSGAIASIALSQKVPAIDGNVERVYARINADPNTDRKKAANEWVSNIIPASRPGDFNQALMDLGATVCKPAAPSCTLCPLKLDCKAFAKSMQDDLPTPKKRPKMVELQHVVWVPYCKGKFGIRQIAEGRWWSGMYEFPRVDQKETASLKQLIPTGKHTGLPKTKHVVTKHNITIEVSLVQTESRAKDLRWCDPEELNHLPMPAPQRRIAQNAQKAIKEI